MKNKQQKIEIEKTEKQSAYKFFKKHKKVFSLNHLELLCDIPKGTLSKILNGRKPSKQHLRNLENYKSYLLHELKNN